MSKKFWQGLKIVLSSGRYFLYEKTALGYEPTSIRVPVKCDVQATSSDRSSNLHSKKLCFRGF